MVSLTGRVVDLRAEEDEQAASASSDLRKAMGADASTGWRATSSNGNLAKHFA